MTSPDTGEGRGTYGSSVHRSKRNGGPMRMLHKKSQEEPMRTVQKGAKEGKVGHFRALHMKGEEESHRACLQTDRQE